MVAAVERGPVTGFDLLWYLPREFTFWAWPSTGDRDFILPNATTIRSIDGFIGSSASGITHLLPKLRLTYKGFGNVSNVGKNTSDRLHIRAEFFREPDSISSPVLRSYSVLVK